MSFERVFYRVYHFSLLNFSLIWVKPRVISLAIRITSIKLLSFQHFVVVLEITGSFLAKLQFAFGLLQIKDFLEALFQLVEVITIVRSHFITTFKYSLDYFRVGFRNYFLKLDNCMDLLFFACHLIFNLSSLRISLVLGLLRLFLLELLILFDVCMLVLIEQMLVFKHILVSLRIPFMKFLVAHSFEKLN